MNATIPELQNLANGSAAAGDQLAEKICLDAIAEIERLQAIAEDFAALDERIQTARSLLSTMSGLILRIQCPEATVGKLLDRMKATETGGES